MRCRHKPMERLTGVRVGWGADGCSCFEGDTPSGRCPTQRTGMQNGRQNDTVHLARQRSAAYLYIPPHRTQPPSSGPRSAATGGGGQIQTLGSRAQGPSRPGLRLFAVELAWPAKQPAASPIRESTGGSGAGRGGIGGRPVCVRHQSTHSGAEQLAGVRKGRTFQFDRAVERRLRYLSPGAVSRG